MTENVVWFLVFGALFYFMMRKGGCGMHVHGGHQHGDGGHAGHGAPSTTGTDEVRDPVCGMTLHAESAAGASTHDGQTYYFCSARCQRTFLDNPAKYAG